MVLGIGMAMGLYEAAFATLGVLYGRAARRPITLVTLVAGFASTVGWPMSAALVPLLGWRGTCLAYAAMLLLVVLPLYWLLPKAAAPAEAAPGAAPEAADPPLPAAWVRRSFLLLAVFFTLRAIISATLSVHLIAVLGGLGLSVTAAVGRRGADGPGPGRRAAAGIHPRPGGASADRGAAGRGAAAAGGAAAGAGRAGGGGALRAAVRRQQRDHDDQPRRAAARRCSGRAATRC